MMKRALTMQQWAVALVARFPSVGFMRPSFYCTAALLSVAAAAPQEGTVERQDDQSFAPRQFQLYDTQAARAIASEATDHIAAQRWAEAVVQLQSLIEEHEGEVLGGARPIAEGAPRPSEMPVHAGAGTWAVARLFELPSEGRAFYQRRFGSRAEAALTRALAAGDRGALARVAERWPITDAA